MTATSRLDLESLEKVLVEEVEKLKNAKLLTEIFSTEVPNLAEAISLTDAQQLLYRYSSDTGPCCRLEERCCHDAVKAINAHVAGKVSLSDRLIGIFVNRRSPTSPIDFDLERMRNRIDNDISRILSLEHENVIFPNRIKEDVFLSTGVSSAIYSLLTNFIPIRIMSLETDFPDITEAYNLLLAGHLPIDIIINHDDDFRVVILQLSWDGEGETQGHSAEVDE